MLVSVVARYLVSMSAIAALRNLPVISAPSDGTKSESFHARGPGTITTVEVVQITSISHTTVGVAVISTAPPYAPSDKANGLFVTLDEDAQCAGKFANMTDIPYGVTLPCYPGQADRTISCFWLQPRQLNTDETLKFLTEDMTEIATFDGPQPHPDQPYYPLPAPAKNWEVLKKT